MAMGQWLILYLPPPSVNSVPCSSLARDESRFRMTGVGGKRSLAGRYDVGEARASVKAASPLTQRQGEPDADFTLLGRIFRFRFYLE